MVIAVMLLLGFEFSGDPPVGGIPFGIISKFVVTFLGAFLETQEIHLWKRNKLV